MPTITLLVENTVRGAGVLGEHGLSFWLQTDAHGVLFDTGQGLALLNNAARFNIELSQADAIVLSHGHYDHVGGLEAALAAAPKATLFLHPQTREKKYSGSDPSTGGRCISTEFVTGKAFPATGRRVVATRESCEIVPGVWATGEIPRLNDYEDTGGPFYLDAALTNPDPLLDDQALYFSSRDGIVVVLGCAHAGVVNTLERVATLTGETQIFAVVGGMHLELASERRMRETVAALRRFRVQQIAPLHCTGWLATMALWREFPDRCVHCVAGSRLIFPAKAGN